MTYPPDAEALRLQQEAVARVRRMQERQTAAVSSGRGSRETPAPAMPTADSEPSAPAPAPERAQQLPHRPAMARPHAEPDNARRGADIKSALDALFMRGGRESSLSSLSEGISGALDTAAEPVKRLLEGLDLGGEELIILLVMYVVFREKGDTALLLALGYLLL